MIYHFYESIETSQMPQDWRDANVTPVHKKGQRNNCNNYRPVSLTSQVVKILERIIQDNSVIMYDGLNRYNIPRVVQIF